MTTAHDIGKAIIKTEIAWNGKKSMWTVTITRLDGSSSSWEEQFMQDATDTIQRTFETEESWP